MGKITRVVTTFSCDYCSHHLLAYAEGLSKDISEGQLDTWLNSVENRLEWIPVKGDQPPPFLDVPEQIAEAAQEAYRCRSIGAHRAAVLMARSVVEATAKEKGITNGMLITKIDKMYDMRLIREDVRDGAHEVRYFGNDMAHGDFIGSVTHEDSHLVLVLMTDVLEEVFERPARVAKAKAARANRNQSIPTS